jgi:glycosyltransferase involved in cell wall biosynthesis
MHGIPWENNKFFALIEKLTSFISNAVIALTETDRNWLISRNIVAREKLHVIPNGLSFQDLQDVQPKTTLFLELGIPTGAPIIGMVARLKPQKHPELFLKMASKVLMRRPDCHFVLVGDGKLKKLVKALARELGIQEHIHLLGWRNDALSLIRSFTVFALTSRWEGLPLVLIETSILGTPIVATKVRGIKNVIKHEHTGLLASSDPDALAAAIIRILSDPDLRKKLSHNAQEVAQRNYGIENVAKATHFIYSQSRNDIQ